LEDRRKGDRRREDKEEGKTRKKGRQGRKKDKEERKTRRM
jgi:hypothetical protein